MATASFPDQTITRSKSGRRLPERFVPWPFASVDRPKSRRARNSMMNHIHLNTFIYYAVPEDVGGTHRRRLVFTNAREHNSEWEYRQDFKSLERRIWTVSAYAIWSHVNCPLHAFTWKQVI